MKEFTDKIVDDILILKYGKDVEDKHHVSW